MSKVLLITNIPAPYRVDLFYYMQTHQQTHEFFVIYTNRNEDNRQWVIDERKLLQSTILKSKIIKHKGEGDVHYLHIPQHLTREITRINPDVVIAWEYNPSALKALLWCKRHGRKFIHLTDGTLRSERNIGRVQKLMRHIIIRHADACIASSTKAKEKLLHWGVPERKIFLSLLTVDISRFRYAEKRENQHTLLFVGRIIPLKGLDLLLRALPKVHQPFELLIVGDGEAETGPLATSWHGNKFMNPITDGAVLPILHLNGFKIANPTIFSRMSHGEVESFFRGCGWEPRFVEGDEPMAMHQQMAAALDWAIREIRRIQRTARKSGEAKRPRWPMLVLRTPKGWTGPKEVDGLPVEGCWRAHQVPISLGADTDRHLAELEEWLRSYKPEELFNADGTPVEPVAAFPPAGKRRMGANPHTNGGLLLRDLRTPDFRDYAVEVKAPGAVEAQDMYVLGTYVRDVMKLNMDARNFRIFAPDETASNRLQAVFEVTGRRFLDEQLPGIDDHLDPDGRVMDSMLSEHFCEGFLEGYLLTGRHGFFDSYEAFIRIVDSMFSQHAKWLKMCNELPWRHDIASLNYILASNVWQQDHNGFTHQDPGFLDHAANKKADVVRMYLPPDANCLLSCFDHCIKSRNYVNVMVASKHPRPQWLTMEQAVKHCTQGIGIWDWASNDAGCEPDVVMACCGDTPTLETLAAVSILRRELPELKIRVVNVVDLMKLQPHTEHPHGLTDEEYDTLFTKDKPIIFAYHGYPTLIHELTYRRHNRNLHVRGYKEEGTITTPFDMRVLNDIDRFDLVIDTVQRLPQLGNRGAYLIQKMNDKLVEHRQYIKDNGVDLPEVRAWKWNDGKGVEV